MNLNVKSITKNLKVYNKKFKGFSKFFLNNYCEDCYKYKNEIYDNDIIRFDEIKIEEKKIEEINDTRDLSEELSEEKSNFTIYNKINENTYEKLSKEEYQRFNF